MNILKQEITKQEINKDSIFYIGLGKTGSASLFSSFPNRPTFHYHNYHYFNFVNGCNLKSNQELINFISNIGFMLGFKPVVIESIREPIERAISCLYHNTFNLDHDVNELLNYDINILKNDLEVYLKEKPFYSIVDIPKNITHIKLNLENIKDWKNELKKYNINDYNYREKNINKDKLYLQFKERVKNNIRWKKEELDYYYSFYNNTYTINYKFLV